MSPSQTGVVRNKREMYRLLAAGCLGNTIPQYFSLADWEAGADTGKYTHWGVRVLRPGDPRMRLNVPAAEVPGYVRSAFLDGAGFNLSPMIDQWATLKGDLWEADMPPYGLWLHCSTEASVEWHEALRRGRTCRGAASHAVLRSYLTPSSYEDLLALLERFPGHVVEFSACDRNVGLIPGRNAVIWEVRCATGEYERATWGVA